MAVVYMALAGIAVGLIAHLILGNENGYGWIGECLLGIVGAMPVGLVVGIFVGLKGYKPEAVLAVVIASVAGAAVSLAIIVIATLRSRRVASMEQPAQPAGELS